MSPSPPHNYSQDPPLTARNLGYDSSNNKHYLTNNTPASTTHASTKNKLFNGVNSDLQQNTINNYTINHKQQQQLQQQLHHQQPSQTQTFQKSNNVSSNISSNMSSNHNS